MRTAIAKTINQMGLMRLGMMACCAIMLVPVGAFFLAGGTIAGLGSNLAFFAPLLFCLGAHLLLHKFIGGLCHSKEQEVAETPVEIHEPTEDATAQR